jgi:tryptophan-rich sensory protein
MAAWRHPAIVVVTSTLPATDRRPIVTLSSVVGLFVFIVVCAAAAAMGARFRPGEWYARLRKPSWRPPNWLFAPVWSLLYLMIAVAGWLVWLPGGLAASAAPLALWLGQLVLNAAWTPAFFGLRRPDLGLVVIAVLWLAIVATVVAFAAFSTAAALLMLPYLAWVSFATALNFAIWRLNGSEAVIATGR